MTSTLTLYLPLEVKLMKYAEYVPSFGVKSGSGDHKVQIMYDDQEMCFITKGHNWERLRTRYQIVLHWKKTNQNRIDKFLIHV